MGGGLCFFANIIEGDSLPSGLVPGSSRWKPQLAASLLLYCRCQLSPRWDKPEMNPALAKNTWLTYLFFSPSSILTKPSRILATRSLGPVALIKINEPSFNSRMAPSIL